MQSTGAATWMTVEAVYTDAAPAYASALSDNHGQVQTYTVNPDVSCVLGSAQTLTPGGLAATSHGTIYSMLSSDAMVVNEPGQSAADATASLNPASDSAAPSSATPSTGPDGGSESRSDSSVQTPLSTGHGNTRSALVWTCFAVAVVFCLRALNAI